jgi:nucleotide-binding universal stress UspA family protein
MYNRTLIVVGAGPTSRAAVAEGVALARAHDADVHFFSVLPRYVVPVADMPMLRSLSRDEFQREAMGNAQRYLAAATVTADKAGVRSKYAAGAGTADAQCMVEAATQASLRADRRGVARPKCRDEAAKRQCHSRADHAFHDSGIGRQTAESRHQGQASCRVNAQAAAGQAPSRSGRSRAPPARRVNRASSAAKGTHTLPLRSRAVAHHRRTGFSPAT